VQHQEQSQEVGDRPDLVRVDVEHVEQGEVLCRVFPEWPWWPAPCDRSLQVVETTPIER